MTTEERLLALEDAVRALHAQSTAQNTIIKAMAAKLEEMDEEQFKAYQHAQEQSEWK